MKICRSVRAVCCVLSLSLTPPLSTRGAETPETPVRSGESSPAPVAPASAPATESLTTPVQAPPRNKGAETEPTEVAESSETGEAADQPSGDDFDSHQGQPESTEVGDVAARELGTTPDPELEEVAKELDRAFEVVTELLSTKQEEIAAKTNSAALTPELTAALREWENAGGENADRTNEILELLERLRKSVALELLVIVTQNGEVFAAASGPVSAGRADSFRRDVRQAAEPVLREARASSSTEAFTLTEGDRSGRGLFQTSASPIFLRPDAPHSVLIGANNMASYVALVDAVLDHNTADLDWHIFVTSGPDQSTAIVGPRAGESPAPALVEELLAGGTASGSGFTEGLSPLGRWRSIVGSDGRVLGGWGINVNESFLDALLSTASLPAVGEQSPKAGPGTDGRDAQVKIFFLILAATGSLGLVLVSILAFVSILRRRRTDREIPSVEGLAAPPTSAPSNGKDLVSQFERNWKTFASYTQDMLQESLKEIEQAPHQDVKDLRERVELAFEELVNARKDIARIEKNVQSSSSDEQSGLAGTLVEIKNQLSIARDEVKNSSNGVVRRVTAALNQLAPPEKLDGDLEDLLRRVELELLESKQGFGLLNETVLKLAEILSERQAQEIEQSIEEEVAKVRAEWEEREGERQRQVEHAHQQLEPLLKELEEARQNERELRGDLEEAAARQTQLESELEEEKAKTEFLTTEREEAWRRERKVVEELREAERRQKEAPEKQRALEVSLHELEVEIEERREREEELREELEESHASEIEARAQLKEQHQEEERLREEFEEERRQMRTRLERLESKNAELEERVGEDPGERERLRAETGAQARELETLRNAYEALKVERQHLQDEVTRLSREATERLEEGDATTQSLKTELAKAKADLAAKQSQITQYISQAELHTEVVDQLRTALADAETELTRREIELTELRNQLEVIESSSSTADVEQLQKSLIDTGRELRQSLQDRLSLNTQIKEREAVWQSRLNTLELQAAEANRKLTETQNKLVESDQVIRDLEAQLSTVHETTRADARTYERIQILKREKHELVRSLDGLKNELRTLQSESSQMRHFQGALVEGSLPVAIIACDKKLKVFAWNSAAETLWQRTSGEVQGRSLSELNLTPEDEITTLAKTTVRTGRPENIDEFAWSRPDEPTRHLRISCDPVKSPEKGVEGAVICVDDISTEVEQRMEARLQSLFAESLSESLPAALIILDGRDRITSWNHVAESLFGIESDRAIGQEIFSLDTPLNRAVFRRRFVKAKQQEKQKKLRIRMDVTGTPIHCIVTQCPFKSRENTPCGTLLLVEEVGTK